MRRLAQAAREGDADAQFNLAVLYDRRTDDNGYAITGNRTEAIKWLLAAAQQGLPRAQIRLAEMYADRPHGDGNPTEACFWLLLAESNLAGAQREKASSGYARAAARLSPTQIAAVSERVWLRQRADASGAAAGLPPESRKRSARP